MKCLILLTVFLLMLTVLFRTVPARAQASAILPIRVKLISYADSKQICCFSQDSNDWCGQMAPHLWILNGVVFDDRRESVPREARLCA